MLVLCLSICFSSLGQPIIAMSAYITIIPKRQCLKASWNPLYAAKLLMTYPIRKTLMLGYNNGNIVVLSLLLFRMTLPISLMIPLLSVFVAR